MAYLDIERRVPLPVEEHLELPRPRLIQNRQFVDTPRFPVRDPRLKAEMGDVPYSAGWTARLAAQHLCRLGIHALPMAQVIKRLTGLNLCCAGPWAAQI